MGFFDGFSSRPKADSAAPRKRDSRVNFDPENPYFHWRRRSDMRGVGANADR
jgi:hypothetical protein